MVANKLFPLPSGPDAGQLQNPQKISAPPLNQTNQNNNYWINYDGTKVKVYEGTFGDADGSILIETLAGTSGGVGYQNSGNQNIPKKGPVPEGDYTVNLAISPRNRMVNYASDGQTNEASGVQQMVDKNGNGFNAAWGRWRARLEKTENNTSRDNFYFHDSYKGYSHGCIETETRLFYFFLSLHDAGITNIKVRVNYPNSNTITNGGTNKIPLIIPQNVISYYKECQYPPGALGNKKYGKIPVPRAKYKYVP